MRIMFVLKFIRVNLMSNKILRLHKSNYKKILTFGQKMKTLWPIEIGRPIWDTL